jgi:tRNA(Ile)-lysidine synthase
VGAAARLVGEVRRRWRSLGGGADGLVVAVSGGPDSVALLRAVIEARDSHAPAPVVVAHLNHQLRGAESDTDEQFVVELHAALVAAGTPALQLFTQRIDVRARAVAEGANVEALARRERYRFLAEAARAHGLRWVATGHTANDQAETVLHRLLRGTGLQGLRGIAAFRPLEDGVSVVRPLLRVTREEIVAALTEWGQPYRLDRSNEDRRLTRNRIRHELLPYLANQYNPGVVAVLNRLAEQADEAFQEEETFLCDLLRESQMPRAGSMLVFDGDRLRAAPRRLVRGAFRLVWAREGWPVGGMGFEAWDWLAGVVFGDLPAVDLPGKIQVRRRGRVVQVMMRTGSDRATPAGEAE